MGRRLPSLRSLQAFEVAARLGRMTLAADELSVTHGAISRQIRHLEEVVGVKLFEGPKNALRLTQAGQTLQPHLSIAFDQMAEGVKLIKDEEEGVLDVSCLGTLAMRWLIPHLFHFREEQPGIEVRLTTSDALIDFARERYEVAVRIADNSLPRDAIVTELFPDRVGPVLAPALNQVLALAKFEDLARASLLHTKTRPNAWVQWAQAVGWQNNGFLGAEYEHFYFMLEAATSGLGVCIASWPLVIDDILAGRLIAPFGFRPTGQSFIAARRDRRSKKAEIFCRWLETKAKERRMTKINQ